MTVCVQPNRKQGRARPAYSHPWFNSAEWSSDGHSRRKWEMGTFCFSFSSFLPTIFCLTSFCSQQPSFPSDWVTSPGPIIWYFPAALASVPYQQKKPQSLDFYGKQFWAHSGPILDLWSRYINLHILCLTPILDKPWKLGIIAGQQ